ncbi:MAG: NusG domain II-containing protein [Lachnospiraceae bacterium]|nr:NusG domain II-containing protein [Lachnospiraceae bacterium]
MKENKSYIVPAICLSVFLLLVTVFSLFWIFSKTMSSNEANGSASAPMIAEIYQNGELLKSIPLRSDVSTQFTITGDNDCYNVISINNSSIAITEANCPDKLCVHQGFISNSLLPITCLPNGVVIQVRENHSVNVPATETDPGIDAITY